jgi:hypothetical protein
MELKFVGIFNNTVEYMSTYASCVIPITLNDGRIKSIHVVLKILTFN